MRTGLGQDTVARAFIEASTASPPLCSLLEELWGSIFLDSRMHMCQGKDHEGHTENRSVCLSDVHGAPQLLTHPIEGKQAEWSQAICPKLWDTLWACPPAGTPWCRGLPLCLPAYLHGVVSIGENVQQVSRGHEVEPWERQPLGLQVFSQCFFTHSQARGKEGKGLVGPFLQGSWPAHALSLHLVFLHRPSSSPDASVFHRFRSQNVMVGPRVVVFTTN